LRRLLMALLPILLLAAAGCGPSSEPLTEEPAAPAVDAGETTPDPFAEAVSRLLTRAPTGLEGMTPALDGEELSLDLELAPGLTARDVLFHEYGFVKEVVEAFTALEGVDSVRFTVGGEPLTLVMTGGIDLSRPVREVPGGGRGPVPVLMYHQFGDVESPLVVDPGDLVAQLDYLSAEGYRTITLRHLLEHFLSGEPLPPRPVVLTFDDGYRTLYDLVFPLLRERSMVATAFLITGNVSVRETSVTWDMAREMAELGLEIGAHTITHPDLRTLSAAELERQLKGSRRVLEERLGVEVLFFSYPAGRYDDRVREAVVDAGYLGAVTTAYGVAAGEDDPFQWPRVRINRGEGLDIFRAKLHTND